MPSSAGTTVAGFRCVALSVPGAGQQLAGAAGDFCAGLAHEGPEPLGLGAQPVIVPAQPVVVCLKLSYLMGQRLQRCHDVLARLVCQLRRLPAWCGFTRRRCGWLAGAGQRDHVHKAARPLVPVGADKPLRLPIA